MVPLRDFLAELKRRKVYHVAVIYAAVAFTIVEGAELVLEALLLPFWAYRFLVVVALLGFPVALVLAWVFEITRQGVRRTEPLTDEGAPLRHRMVMAARSGLVLTVVAVAALAVVLARARSGGELDPNLVAVMPFDVLDPDPELQFWHEGLMDVLAPRLDGAGPLRSVPPSVIAKRWSGRAERSSALDLAREIGAGLALYGQLVGGGHDSVRLSATLLDTAVDWPLGEIEELHGIEERIGDDLADSLALDMLSALASSRSLTFGRIGSLGTSSPAAYKAFLRGEQYYRRANRDSAAAQYTRATELDSTFALAFNRLAEVGAWRLESFYRLMPLYLKAGALNHGLARRDSLLIAADSLWAAGVGEECSRFATWPVVQSLFSTLDQAVRDYPLDPAAWYRLGEARYHVGPWLGVSVQEMYDAFARAIQLDSTYLIAHGHMVDLNLVLAGAERAREVIAKIQAQGPEGYVAEGLALTDALLDPARAVTEETDRLLADAATDALESAFWSVFAYPDSMESQVRLMRAITENEVAPPWTDQVFAYTLAYRGHLREATAIPGVRDMGRGYIFADLADLGAVPRDTVAAVYGAWLETEHDGCTWRARNAFRWWMLQGDTASLARAVAAADSVHVSGPDTAAADYVRGAAHAYLALARGDTLGALTHFFPLPRWVTVLSAYREHLTLAQLLSLLGRDEEAARIVDQVPSMQIWLLPGQVLWVLERGRVNERLGNREKAMRAYKYVTDVWRHADPELRPYVDEARSALGRLAGET